MAIPRVESCVACYKARLSAQVAAKLDEESRSRFCSPPRGTYVQDRHLENAFKEQWDCSGSRDS